jgi:Tol biopolymer transport system component
VNLYSLPVEGEGGFLQLTADPEFEASPRWSPDGRRIAYLRYADAEDPTTSVRIMDAWGGGEREVAVIRQAFNPTGRVDWTRDGEALIVGTADAGLVRIAVRDGAKTPLGLAGDQPSVSPDGRAVVYRRDGAIFRASLGGRTAERQLAVKGSHPVWSGDGKEVIYSWGAKLWRVENATGGLLGEVSLSEPSVEDVQAAPPVRNAPFLYARHANNKIVIRMDLASEERKRVVDGDFPDISPDGKSIVYTDGGGELWMCDREGRDARPIHMRRGELIQWPFFDASGTRVIFAANAEEHVLDLATGTVKKTVWTESRRLYPQEKLPPIHWLESNQVSVTADGRTVVFAQLEWPGWDIRKIENYR